MQSGNDPHEGDADDVDAFMDALYDQDDSDSRPRVREKILRPGRLVGERYLLGELIARGGMASIWEADDQKLGRGVAVKFMGAAYSEDPEYRERFEQEAKAAAMLNTPYVVQIHDHGVLDGVPYIVMERLHGEDLHERLQRQPRLPPEFCLQIATEAGRALKVAHAAGIVHRDLKPKNLFIARVQDEETIKLLDFGVAKHAGTAALMTATGVMLGSPYYMSPEQIRCERNLDARTDLWSLVAILYRCLTGQKPFDGDMARVMFQITREKPPLASKINPELSPALDAFFDKGLATKREDRFSTANELIDAFAKVLQAPSPSRRPPNVLAAPAGEEEDEEEPELGDDDLLVSSGDRVSTRTTGAPPPKRTRSDHPTFAAPAAMLEKLGALSAQGSHQTGLHLDRMGIEETIAKPRSRTQVANLTAETDFSGELDTVGLRRSSIPRSFAPEPMSPFDSRFQPQPVFDSLPPIPQERKWIYVVAGMILIVSMLVLAGALVIILR